MKTNKDWCPGAMQKIALECDRRPDPVTDLLKNYDNERQYYLNDERLSLEKSLKIYDHSPAGFFHGYNGSGPSQLALAVCLKLYPLQVAKAVYQYFKEEYIAAIPKEKEQFNVVFEVPTDPLAYWKIKHIVDQSYDEDYELANWELSEEEIQENERIRVKNERLQLEHDQAYQQVIQLPDSIRYGFTGLNNFASFCYLRVVSDYQGKVLIIATDPDDHTDSGSSITNAAEQVATQVCREFNIPFERLDWIERYVRTASIYQYKNRKCWDFEESRDRVSFMERNGKLAEPDWKPLRQTEIEHLRNVTDTR